MELAGEEVRVVLSPAGAHTSEARLRIERPGAPGDPAMSPLGDYASQRGAFVVPLGEDVSRVVIR